MNRNHERALLLLLAALVVATRPYHFSSFLHVPDASIAAFFLSGALLPPAGSLAVLLALAVGIDAAVLADAGGAHYCVTRAYAAVPAAYALLWFGGRAVRASGGFSLAQLPRVAVLLCLSVSASFLLTTGAFHFTSERVVDPSWASFVTRVRTYYVGYLWSPVPYCAMALGAASLWRRIEARRPHSA